MDDKNFILDFLLKNDEAWCNALGIFNPYIDPFEYNWSKNVPMYDILAYEKYPKYNFVYDKLWVAKSCGLNSGELKNLHKKDVEYPIFIKPRWGHKTASSKGCFKIKSYEEVIPYLNNDDMMWSEFIDAKEGMTDFILHNGEIKWQMTLVYSDTQKGFIDDWKSIDMKHQPPEKVVSWVNEHLKGFSGIVNMQYRSDKVIEASLRPARGGSYLKSCNNENIVKNINNIIDYNIWDETIEEHMKYEPFYSFKCYTKAPIIYLLPQHLIDLIMYISGSKEFYEYYFEPSGKSGMVFFQFYHSDYSKGQFTKSILENIIFALQYIFILLFIILIYFMYLGRYFKDYKFLFYITIILFSSQIINPITTFYSKFKAQKQQLL